MCLDTCIVYSLQFSKRSPYTSVVLQSSVSFEHNCYEHKHVLLTTSPVGVDLCFARFNARSTPNLGLYNYVYQSYS